ncbi:phosphatase PAP2 family protein [Cesiribacter andamanensis]|uniref:Major phosphate-irrepressible acid phosphatase n=1 Tax=Cesiribacter andamanensis AMV16 TaxID=1279009 RepID=M7NMK5_9BACT|nr:phosphatase PAP2 family protein [Cesiribacter andamanensis]EMR03005.1 Major phosphate-irrepressible acid phosphatase precursor [Cesiribacter andamanensis AMV16]
MEPFFSTPGTPSEQKPQLPIHLAGISFVSVFILLILLLISLSGFAQQLPSASAFGGLVPADDHYSRLRSVSASPLDNALDALAFPEADFRRKAYLNLKTTYVRVPVSRFALQPYPANSSTQTRTELDLLLQLQARRTAQEIALTDSMANVYYDPLLTNTQDPDWTRNQQSLFYIGRGMGAWFAPEQLPLTSRVLQAVLQDATYYIFSLKADYSRPRPYQLEAGLQPLEMPGHAAYPSGHASASYLHAYLLCLVLPEYKELLLQRAWDMAFSREIRGVHYPSDSEAGKKFAQQFVALLMKDKQFQQDLALMKAEIRKVKQAGEIASRK